MDLSLLNFIAFILLISGLIIVNRSQDNINDNHNLIALSLNEKIEKQQKQIDQIFKYLNIETKDGNE